MGLSGDDGRAGPALHADPAPDAHGRTAAGAFRPDLLLLRGRDPVVPRAGERGHDHRPDARDGHSVAVHELWRFVAYCVYHFVVHRRAARRFDAAVFPELNTAYQ